MATARILLVEDHAETLALYETYLTLEGFEVTAVSTATEALRLVAPGRFDAISTDLAMPGMDGGEFIRRIRDSIQPAIPLIVITGQLGSAGAAQSGLNCCAVFVKPCDLEQVAETLRVLVRECPRSCGACRRSFAAVGSRRHAADR